MRRVSVATLRRRIEAWLRAKDLAHDTRTYSRREWTARGEPYGVKAALTLTAEGAFYRVWNGDVTENDVRLIADFGKLLADAGYWYEQGFAWSWHFYPVAATFRRAVTTRSGRDMSS